MFDILCSLPLSSELFAQALNPVEPLLAVGLASGHVETFRLPVDGDDQHRSHTSSSSAQAEDDDDDDDTTQAPGRRSSLSSRSSPTPLITSAWRTRRHHGSCRALAYSALDGAHLFSGGSDGLVKCADSATGRVVAKIAIARPADARRHAAAGPTPPDFDAPSVLHALTPTALLVAGDSGAVHLFDTRAGSSGGLSSTSTSTSKSKAKASSTSASTSILAARPAATWMPHGDYVSGIAAVPASGTSTSGLPRAFLSVGAASLALTDVRKGVVVATAAEGPELLTGVAVSSGGSGGRVVVGDASGGLTSWDRGAVATWSQGGGRVRVHVTRALVTPEGDSLPVPGLAEGEDAGIEVLCAVPAGSSAERELGEDAVVLGWDSGRVEVVALKGKKGKARTTNGTASVHEGMPATRGAVVADFPPDVGGEGVSALGFDAVGRLVVATGDKVTIYAQTAQTAVDWVGEESGADEGRDESDDDDDDDDDDDEIMEDAAAGVKRPARDSSAEDESSEEEEKQKPKHKKKKKKGKTQKNHLSFGLSGID